MSFLFLTTLRPATSKLFLILVSTPLFQLFRPQPLGSLLKFYNFILCIYFWLHWVFVGAWAFSNCSEQGLLSSCSVWAFSWRWLPCLLSMGSRPCRLPSCVFRALEQGSVGVAHALSFLRRVGSSQVRDQTCVPCSERWIPNVGPAGKPRLGGSFLNVFSQPSSKRSETPNQNRATSHHLLCCCSAFLLRLLQ